MVYSYAELGADSGGRFLLCAFTGSASAGGNIYRGHIHRQRRSRYPVYSVADNDCSPRGAMLKANAAGPAGTVEAVYTEAGSSWY